MSFPARLEQLLEEGRIAIRGMVKFQLGTGTYGFWTGNYDLPWDGIVYRPNQLISIEDRSFGVGLEGSGFKIELPAKADFGVTPDLLLQIEQLDYKNRPVTVYEAYFDPDTRQLLHVEAIDYGYIDIIDHVNEDGQLKLVGKVMTGAIDNHRDGYRSASHEDQQLVSPGDMGFEHAGRVKTEDFDIEL
jgi:hypothetical protein